MLVSEIHPFFLMIYKKCNPCIKKNSVRGNEMKKAQAKAKAKQLPDNPEFKRTAFSQRLIDVSASKSGFYLKFEKKNLLK